MQFVRCVTALDSLQEKNMRDTFTAKMLENQGLLEQKGDRVNNTPCSVGFSTVCCREQVRHTGAGQTRAPAGETTTQITELMWKAMGPTAE